MPDSDSELEQALADLAEPVWTEDGWAPVYIPATGPMAWRPPRRAKVQSPPRQPSSTSRESMDGRCEYTEVNSPSAKTQAVAKAALDLAAGELGLRSIMPAGRGISLRWFGRAALRSDTVLLTGDKRLTGFVRPLEFTAWILHTLSGSETIRTVAHEVRHFWQLHSLRSVCPFADNKAACQRDADRFEDRFWARYGRRLSTIGA